MTRMPSDMGQEVVDSKNHFSRLAFFGVFESRHRLRACASLCARGERDGHLAADALLLTEEKHAGWDKYPRFALTELSLLLSDTHTGVCAGNDV